MAAQNFSLQLVQDQRMQLVLAPQLRQSLEMLQVPILELQSLIQAELEQNPTLEEIPKEATQLENDDGSSDLDTSAELDFKEEFEVLAKLDEEWKDYFFQEDNIRPYSSEDDEKRQFLMDSLPQRESLQEHLLGQLELADFPQDEHELAELLIGNINDDGYLIQPTEQLAEASGYEAEELDEMLATIQEFDPVGVGARDLRECLLIQLHKGHHHDTLVEAIVEDHLKALGARKFKDIAKALKVTPEEVQAAAEAIARLDPKPGSRYTLEIATYVNPEVVVRKVEGEWVVILDDEQLPQLRISNHYRKLMESGETTKEVKSYIRERIQASTFMIKSIHQRQKTIFKIASEIVRIQEGFLEKGVKSLRPLTMSQVADEVGVHETTVSRAVNGKYMKTPSGTFEMRYFFTTGLKTAEGGSISNQTIKDTIAEMVADEPPEKPLSDQEIMEKLAEDGIKVARRTIAKYRTMLRIPASHLRRQY